MRRQFSQRCLGRSVGMLSMLVASTFVLASKSWAAPPSPISKFWTGADLSRLPEREQRGFKYSDGRGEADLLTIIKRNGWNVVRVRLWVNPDSKPEYAVSNLENVTAFGKRIKVAGLDFLLDIHYSDSWADPGQQKKPAGWEKLTFSELVKQTHDYSRQVVAHLRENDALLDLVQIGNETRNGLLFGDTTHPGGGFWEKTPGGIDRAVQIFRAGLDGVREGAAPGQAPLTIIHIPDGQDPGFVKWYFEALEKSKKGQKIDLDFHMIGLSYYPDEPWDAQAGYDGWKMARLAESMNWLATAYGKPVMIVETHWPYRGTPHNLPGRPEFALTPEGQAQYYRTLLATVKAVPQGLGRGVIPWDQDGRRWESVFDGQGRSLPAVEVLGGQ